MPIIALQLVLRTLRWRTLLAGTHPPATPSIVRLMPVLLIGYLANAILPARLGEAVRLRARALIRWDDAL